MPRVKAPGALSELVRTAFAKARSDGELHYFPTQVTVLSINSIPFQLRFSPALANKPKGPPKDPAQPQKTFDPFAYPPGALFLADLGPSHFLVLNKFAIVQEHFILATKDLKRQTDLLEPADLESTLACIEAYEHVRTNPSSNLNDKTSNAIPAADEAGLFAFFNCGEHSGASQPHRHIQLLPIARMKDDLPAGSAWDVLADSLHTRRAPFATFAEKISAGMTGTDLHAAYLRLYRRACRAIAAQTHAEGAAASDDIPEAGETRISYNLAMTKDSLVVCPRLAEGAEISDLESGKALGSLSLNGTVLAGTALVKTQAEWDALQEDNEGLSGLLRKIGIPSDGFREEATKL